MRTVRLRHASEGYRLWRPRPDLRILDSGDPSGLTSFAPAYGRLIAASTLVTEDRCRLPQVVATFIAADAAMASGVRVRHLPIDARPEEFWHPVAVEVAAEGGRVTAILALEGSTSAGDGPQAEWGAGGMRIDGRAAAVAARATGTTAILVSGRALTLEGTPIIDLGAGRASGSACRTVPTRVPSSAGGMSRSTSAQQCVE